MVRRNFSFSGLAAVLAFALVAASTWSVKADKYIGGKSSEVGCGSSSTTGSSSTNDES